MKRKTLFLLSILTVSVVMLSGCKSDTIVSDTQAVVEIISTETEFVAEETTETESTTATTESEAADKNIQYGDDTVFDENGNPIGDYYVLEDTNDDGIPDSKIHYYADDEAIKAEYGSTEAYYEYAKSQDPNVDAVFGYCWVYLNGKGAGNQPSYAIDSRDGKRYEVGDTLPDGTVLNGTAEEYKQVLVNEIDKAFEDAGYESTVDEDGEITYYLD